MNTALFSYRFLLPVLFGWIGHAAGFLALAALARVPIAAGRVVLFALAFSLLGCFVHEKITRCWSPLWERALRFGTLFFVIATLPVATLGAIASEAPALALVIGGWAVSVAGFALPIHLLYRFDPKGDSKYFSVSAKFQTDPRARITP